MKSMILAAACAFAVVSVSAFAHDAADQKKMEEKCRAMGAQHGMKDDKMEGWMKKCMEISEQMEDDMKGNDSSGMDNMEDPQDGDQEMGHDDMGDMKKD